MFITRHSSFLALSVLLLLLISCEKDSDSLPKDAITLSTEKHLSPTKTSVLDLTVQWTGAGDEVVRFYVENQAEQDKTVNVSDGKAYVDDVYGSGAVQAYYPASIIAASGASDGGTQTPTVVIPSRYDSEYSGSRQVLALPMVAKGVVGDHKIEFKHLTAALRVVVGNNITGNALTLDSIVVSSSAYKLSGAMTLDFSASDFDVRKQEGSGSVSVRLSGVTIPSGGEETVQVPILPIGIGDLRIQIYAHRRGNLIGITGVPDVYTSEVYHYDDTKSLSSDLERNVMMTARIGLDISRTPSHTTDTIVDNSLFTINDSGVQVHFSKGNLKKNGSSWSFHDYQYSRSATQSDSERDLFPWSEVSNDWGSLIGTGWRNLEATEWEYIINTRPGTRFAKACVNGVNGLILFPDNYVQPTGITLKNVNIVNKEDAQFFSVYNDFTSAQWTEMEAAGAIFLPAPYSPGGEGHYWSSNSSGDDKAKRLFFSLRELVATNPETQTNSCSIRLVKIAN